MKASRFRFRGYWHQRGRMLTWDEAEKYMCIYADVDINSGMTFDVINGGMSIEGKVTLMQSTGLCDADGIEIFESDIVTDSYSRRMRIDWADNPDHMVQGEYRFEAIINPAENFSTASLGSWWLVGQNKLSVKVIGNIHENPELIS